MGQKEEATAEENCKKRNWQVAGLKESSSFPKRAWEQEMRAPGDTRGLGNHRKSYGLQKYPEYTTELLRPLAFTRASNTTEDPGEVCVDYF